MSEKLCLKWNDFNESITSAFGSLRKEPDFSDVTLVCEDTKHIEAHKIILTAASPFFRNILSRKKHTHPLIYMRGVKTEDLVAIMDFLYYGEASIHQENINSFLALSEELQLKGLAKTPTQVNSLAGKITQLVKPPSQNYLSGENTQSDLIAENSEAMKNETCLEENAEDFFETSEAFTGSSPVVEVSELDEKIKSLMSKSQNKIQEKRSMRTASICTVCGKEGGATQIKHHIEVNHLEGVSMPCIFCEKTFRTRYALGQHKRTCQKSLIKVISL